LNAQGIKASGKSKRALKFSVKIKTIVKEKGRLLGGEASKGIIAGLADGLTQTMLTNRYLPEKGTLASASIIYIQSCAIRRQYS
jgi:hypothetical protein